MSKEEVKNTLAAIFSEINNVPVSEISDDTAFVADMGASCVARCRMQLEIREKTGVLIPSNIAVKMRTVREAVEYVYNNMQI